MNQHAHDYPNKERWEYYSKLYMAYHGTHPKHLSGKVPADKVQVIVDLVNEWRATRGKTKPRLLDYGSGKGYQYLRYRIHDRWGGILPICYDPGVFLLAERPMGLFDGIICTDVLEHIEEQDLGDVLKDLFAYAQTPHATWTKGNAAASFMYLHVCCRPAGKSFADGRNLHFTVRPEKWWRKLLTHYADRNQHVKVVMTFEGAPQEEPLDDEVDAGGEGDLPTGDGPPLPGDATAGTPSGREGDLPAEQAGRGPGIRPEGETPDGA